MNSDDLEQIARSIVADGKGIFAADETPCTLTRRLAADRIESLFVGNGSGLARRVA